MSTLSPDLIAEACSKKLPVVPADNDIQKGIDITYELIKSGNYRVFRGQTKYMLDEMDSYHYPEDEDLKPDQNRPIKFELPVDQNNHAMDCIRYLSIHTYKTNRLHQPKVPDDLPKSDHSVNMHPAVAFQNKIKRQLKAND